MYHEGLRLSLWKLCVEFEERVLRVEDKILVTITRRPCSTTLKSCGDIMRRRKLIAEDAWGRQYEKTLLGRPGKNVGMLRYLWIPKEKSIDTVAFRDTFEAVEVYNSFRLGGRSAKERIMDPCGLGVVPEGDVWHCKTHDAYYYDLASCPYCSP